MSKDISVPFSHLVLYHREIGIHRGREAGFSEIFGLRNLRELLFTRLATRVKDAYEGKNVPQHSGWHDQREALRWLVEKGSDAIYKIDAKTMKLVPCRSRRYYYIFDGHHRALALFILGENELRAKVQHDARVLT